MRLASINGHTNSSVTGVRRYASPSKVGIDRIGFFNALERPVVFLGDGVPVQKEALEANVTVPYRFAPAHLNRQSASAVAALGVVYYKEGKSEDARDHKPIYLRQSQAERERALRLKGEQA